MEQNEIEKYRMREEAIRIWLDSYWSEPTKLRNIRRILDGEVSAEAIVQLEREKRAQEKHD